MVISRSLFLTSPKPVTFSSASAIAITNGYLPIHVSHRSLSSPAASSGTLGLRSVRTSRRRSPHPRFRIAAATTAVECDLAVRVGEDLPEDYGSSFPAEDPSRRRRAGVLLHPSSLPGPYGIGDLGDEALRFLDWLHSTGCSVWQVLPLVPPGRKSLEDGSPYAGQHIDAYMYLLEERILRNWIPGTFTIFMARTYSWILCQICYKSWKDYVQSHDGNPNDNELIHSFIAQYRWLKGFGSHVKDEKGDFMLI